LITWSAVETITGTAPVLTNAVINVFDSARLFYRMRVLP
jgi:hypothetical protein